ncbi:MAG: hypothetical protein KUG79_13500 [Pseudomonadales bacterium]|nr:hypothetical protein [Pseudomonadales bacterium]
MIGLIIAGLKLHQLVRYSTSKFVRVFCFLPLLLVGQVGPLNAEALFGGVDSLAPPEILPVDEAFRLTARRQGGQVRLVWQIAPGYYLYRHRLKVFSEQIELSELTLNPGIEKTDEYFGKVEVYYQLLEVSVFVAKQLQAFTLGVEYQGCADAGICYPPQQKILSL